MSHLFVSATGTDVGKTFVSALLLEAHAYWKYWKPVQTGGHSVDGDAIETLIGPYSRSNLKTYGYDLPASPDQAAAAEDREGPTVAKLLEDMSDAESLLIEGAGGLMVPLNEQNETWLDFLQAGRLSCLLVAHSGLGTLNHTLLSIEALKSRGIPLAAVILNGLPHAANRQSLQRMQPDLKILELPDLSEATAEQRRAEGQRLWQSLGWTPAQKPDSEEWLTLDRRYVWHPYMQHQTAPDPIGIVRGEGAYLYSDRGEKLFDASASWWTCSTGHGNPRIGRAIARQQAQLDHCGFGSSAHEPAARLAEQLVKWTDGQFPKVFYSDNGSCAVEVAMKMAIQARVNQGRADRNQFVFFRGAYHGDTFGAMAVAESGGFHTAFAPYVFKGIEAPLVTAHPSRICPEGSGGLEAGKKALDTLFAEHGPRLGAVIIEPLIQGAGGMLLQDPDWLRHLAQLCKKHDVFLILDEVFTGLGRIGARFAFERAGIEADILCIAKGLTGGVLPLAATLCKNAVFEAFLSEDRSKALLHGHTFTGNPTACAAGLEALRIMEDENYVGRALEMEGQFRDWIGTEGHALGLHNPRTLGALLAFELESGSYFHEAAYTLPAIARREGLLLRTLGSTVYVVPPLCASPFEISSALSGLRRTLLTRRA